jgi:hypothetical protein
MYTKCWLFHKGSAWSASIYQAFSSSQWSSTSVHPPPSPDRSLETFDTGDKPAENFEALELHDGLCANNGTKRIYPEVDQGESNALVFDYIRGEEVVL